MLFWIALSTAVCALVYIPFFEWTLHKYVMHRPFLGIRYAYKAHSLTHHMIFKADYTYHLQDTSLAKKIPMAWWNWMVIIPLGMVPFVIAALLLKPVVGQAGFWVMLGTSLFMSFAYYGVYEYTHLCMHKPLADRQRLVEKSWIFRKQNGHHILHHRYPDHNFNVVLPLADVVLGTYLPRAKTKFAQVRGPSVPDVQPVNTT